MEAVDLPWRAMPGRLPPTLWRAGERSTEVTPRIIHRFSGRHHSACDTRHDLWELVIAMSGHGLLHAGRAFPLAAGRGWLVPPGQPHHESSATGMDVMWIGVDGGYCDRLPAGVLALDPDLGLVRRLWLSSQRPAPGAGVLLDALTRALIAAVRPDPEAPASGGSMTLDACIEHLHRHHARPLTVAGLARRCGCSARHLSRLFLRHTGLPPLRFLRRLRMAHAQRLLMDGQLGIGEVARLVGYGDPAYFSRAFRAETGRPPSAARRREGASP